MIFARRLDRLDVAVRQRTHAAVLRQLATLAAVDAGLDPELVLREAEAMLERNAGRSLPDLAAREGIDLAELEVILSGLSQWEPA